jgi:tetratricopeptide (TPR) repeat protein
MLTEVEFALIAGGLGLTFWFRGRHLLDPMRKHYHAAHIYLVRGDIHAALSEYRTIAFNAPESYGAWRFIELGLEHKSHLNDVISVCHGLLQKRPDDAWLHYALGVALLGTNRLARAREEWTHALALMTDEAQKRNLQQLLDQNPLPSPSQSPEASAALLHTQDVQT